MIDSEPHPGHPCHAPGRITNTHFTTGDGTSKPYGIVTGATLGKTGTTGRTATVIYDDLVDLGTASTAPIARCLASAT